MDNKKLEEFGRRKEVLDNEWEIVRRVLTPERVESMLGILQAAKDLDGDELSLVSELAQTLKNQKGSIPNIPSDQIISTIRESLSLINEISGRT